MGEYDPELAKRKHDDMQALNHARFKMEYHRFCMITWENCIKYACEIVDMQSYDTPALLAGGFITPTQPDDEDPIFHDVCRVSEKIFGFIEHKADEMFDNRFKQLEHDAKGYRKLTKEELAELIKLQEHGKEITMVLPDECEDCIYWQRGFGEKCSRHPEKPCFLNRNSPPHPEK